MIFNLVEKVVEGKISFGELEKLFWRLALNLFQRLLVEVLEQSDKNLMKIRDKVRYKIKESNPRTIQTLVGGITFKRRYYWDKEKHEWLYLLDEALGLEKEKTIGPGLLQLAVTWATKGPSYRDSRDRLSDVFGGQVLSHEAIRQALLEVGASIERDQDNMIVKQEGEKEVKALFIETDGFGARFQKKKGSKTKGRRRETKMVVIHEGWAPRHAGKKTDYKLVNPTYISNLKKAEDFWEQVRGIINAKYRNIDSIPVIINGDGAEWIRQGAASFGQGMYQYDRFHVARELRKALRFDEKKLSKANNALRKNNMGSLCIIVTETMVNCQDSGQREKLEHLNNLLVENHQYIVDYRIRLKEQGFSVPAEWRSLGAAESNVNKFKNRTAKRGRAWSQRGLSAILMTSSRLFEGTLHQTISRVLDDAEEWYLDKITGGAGSLTAGVAGPNSTRQGRLPAAQHGTRGYSKLFNRLHFVDSL